MKKKNGNKKAQIGRIFDRLERQASAKKQRGYAGEPKTALKKQPAEEFVGRVQASGKGYAFLRVEGADKDLFLPARSLHGAMHGDTVRATLREHGTATRGGVAEVTEILERGAKTFVGTVRSVGRFFVIRPDDGRITREADVMSGDLEGARDGDKVVAGFLDYGDERSNPVARVIEVLGNAETVGVDVLGVIRSFGLYEEFPAEVTEAAHAAPAEIDASALAGREDFREDFVITIDGADAKDLDDAVAAARTADGYRLWVHIADVSHYVTEGSVLDREAYRRGTSVYFPDRVLPMLPKELSNGICSLNEGVDRLTTTCIVDFDADGHRLDSRVVKGVIRSKRRMTYEKVQRILDGDAEAIAEYPDLVAPLALMRELTEKLSAIREARGAVDFAVAEPKIILDSATGKIKDVVASPRELSNRMIEEFMLAANEAVAYRFAKLGVPFVYRIHEVPSKEKLEMLRAFVSGFGLKLDIAGDDATPAEIQALLTAAAGKPCENVVDKVTLRAMQKARYSEECKGHFGLAAKFYCHFTSPIRRYPDLAIHRIIGAFSEDGKKGTEKFAQFVAAASEQSSERERLAQEAEREVDDLKKAEFMADHLGEKYEGVISGVTPFGLFVELANTVEGLLRMELLPDDAYDCDETHFVMRGARHTYRLGDPITVIVAAASKESRKVEFCLEGEEDTVERNVPEIRRMVMPSEGREDRFGDIYKKKTAPRGAAGKRKKK